VAAVATIDTVPRKTQCTKRRKSLFSSLFDNRLGNITRRLSRRSISRYDTQDAPLLTTSRRTFEMSPQVVSLRFPRFPKLRVLCQQCSRLLFIRLAHLDVRQLQRLQSRVHLRDVPIRQTKKLLQQIAHSLILHCDDLGTRSPGELGALNRRHGAFESPNPFPYGFDLTRSTSTFIPRTRSTLP
jgi:hypothetical protein